ncbi:MAG: thymidylate synthase [Candidatus Pacebacteria bacterium]|nr:thymidylate synthase [Candidatus Paceibacterota bacterium]
MNDWPKYYHNQLIVNNPSGIAIVCGWTKKELIWNNLSGEARKKVSIIGQLYSKEGINYIIRNIFLNPGVKALIITGSDLSQSLKELSDFLDSGHSDVIHPEIPEEKQKQFFDYFSGRYKSVGLQELDGHILGLEIEEDDWIVSPEDFPEHRTVIVNTFPSEETAFRVEDKKIAGAWLKVLDRIVKFGKEKMSSYDEPQRELLNILTVISEDVSKDPFLPDYMYFKKEDLLNYYPQIMTDNLFEGIEYTYGSRLRNHGGIDQVRGMIDELKRERFSRRAVAFTWSVEKDFNNPKCPCLDIIQAIVQNDKLFLTAYFRSNDMYRAWPQNAYGLLAVQEEIAQGLGICPGKLTIISCSAHIYERDLKEARDVLSKHKDLLECVYDPRGSFVIRVEDGEIVAKHIDPNGLELQEIKGRNCLEMRDRLAPFISDVAHGIYIGTELMKAERALKEGTEYVQDA